jgi:hypothetical protein
MPVRFFGLQVPFFRKRWTAGLSVWLAASVGLFVANYAWHEWPDPAGSAVLGLIMAAVYALGFWDYRPEAPDGPKPEATSQHRDPAT